MRVRAKHPPPAPLKPLHGLLNPPLNKTTPPPPTPHNPQQKKKNNKTKQKNKENKRKTDRTIQNNKPQNGTTAREPDEQRNPKASELAGTQHGTQNKRTHHARGKRGFVHWWGCDLLVARPSAKSSHSTNLSKKNKQN